MKWFIVSHVFECGHWDIVSVFFGSHYCWLLDCLCLNEKEDKPICFHWTSYSFDPPNNKAKNVYALQWLPTIFDVQFRTITQVAPFFSLSRIISRDQKRLWYKLKDRLDYIKMSCHLIYDTILCIILDHNAAAPFILISNGFGVILLKFW